MINFAGKNRVNAPAAMIPIVVDNQLQNTAESVTSHRELNFFSCFKVNYYFLRALGLWPFSFVRDSSGKIQKPKVTKIDLLWFIVSILLYVSASVVYNNTSNVESKYMNNIATYIMHKGEYIRLTLSIFLVTSIIGIDMCNRFKIVNAIKMFIHFDEVVSVSIY